MTMIWGWCNDDMTMIKWWCDYDTMMISLYWYNDDETMIYWWYERENMTGKNTGDDISCYLLKSQQTKKWLELPSGVICVTPKMILDTQCF